jgi:predicted DNA binding protein
MWLLSFTNWHKTCLIRPRCVRYKVADFVYMLNSWVEGASFFYTELHILQGPADGVREFLNVLRKDRTFLKVEVTGNNVFTLNRLPAKENVYDPVFDRRIIYVKPVLQRVDGFEDWELASWEKEPLMRILHVPAFDAKINFIEQRSIKDIFLPTIYPKIAEKQREAVELAVKEGYYEYPRRIHLEKLSEISGVKRQTFQQNLRRAERKLVPFLTERMIA